MISQMPMKCFFFQERRLTKSVINADGPGHPLLSLNRGEHFRGVLKGDRSFTKGVHDCEEVYEPAFVEISVGHGVQDMNILTRRPAQVFRHG